MKSGKKFALSGSATGRILEMAQKNEPIKALLTIKEAARPES